MTGSALLSFIVRGSARGVRSFMVKVSSIPVVVVVMCLVVRGVLIIMFGGTRPIVVMGFRPIVVVVMLVPVVIIPVIFQ